MYNALDVIMSSINRPFYIFVSSSAFHLKLVLLHMQVVQVGHTNVLMQKMCMC